MKRDSQVVGRPEGNSNPDVLRSGIEKDENDYDKNAYPGKCSFDHGISLILAVNKFFWNWIILKMFTVPKLDKLISG
jgi:hypothetical protein